MTEYVVYEKSESQAVKEVKQSAAVWTICLFCIGFGMGLTGAALRIMEALA